MTKLLAPRLRPRPFRERDLARMVEALSGLAVPQWLGTRAT
jgi:hypothetical protein